MTLASFGSPVAAQQFNWRQRFSFVLQAFYQQQVLRSFLELTNITPGIILLVTLFDELCKGWKNLGQDEGIQRCDDYWKYSILQ